MIAHFTFIVAVTLWLLSTWAVLAKRVRDGLIIKFGLMLMSVGFFGVAFAENGIPAYKSILTMLSTGAVVCLIGVVLRIRRRSCSKSEQSWWQQR